MEFDDIKYKFEHVNKKENACKGQIFKADVSFYRTSRGFAETTKLNLMKRMSCPGCEYCGWVFEEISKIGYGYDFTIPNEIEHGKFYTLVMTNPNRDWETGVVDDWDVEVVEFEPQTKGKKDD